MVVPAISMWQDYIRFVAFKKRRRADKSTLET
jgi:hypothetical protein